MSKILEMVFKTDSGKQKIIRVTNPKDDLTIEAVTAVMQEIISKAIFTTTDNSNLAEVVEARLVERNVAVLQ